MKTINEDKKVEILSESVSASKFELKYHPDTMKYMEDAVVRDLMTKFYSKCLKSGKEYKCKFKMETTSKKEDCLTKTTGYLYVRECEENEKD